MKKFFLILITGLFLLSFSFAQEKYAYVDLLKVINFSKKAKELRKDIEQKLDYYKQQAKQIEEEIKNIEQQLKSPLLSKEAKKEKQSKLRELERQLTQLTIDAQQVINQMKQKAEQKLLEKINLIAKEYSAKKGLDIIFTNGMVGAVIYADNKIDITDEIIELFDGEKGENK